MSVLTTSFPEFVKELPPEIQSEVVDFAEFLLEKRKKSTKNEQHGRQLGSLKDSVQIVGDIVEPACNEEEWEVLRG